MPATLGSIGSDPQEATLLPGYMTRISLNYKLEFLLLQFQWQEESPYWQEALTLMSRRRQNCLYTMIGRWGGEGTHGTHAIHISAPWCSLWMNTYSNPSLRWLWLYRLEKKKQKIFSPKVETYILFGKLWGLQAQEAASQTALRDCSEEGGEEPGHMGVLQQKPDNQNIKRSLFIKENQTSS